MTTTMGVQTTASGTSFTRTWGPGGSANGYQRDSNLYVSNYGLQASWNWIGGFGGPHPMDNTTAYSYTTAGLDGHDSAWGHVRRLEGNGFIYWTPNNSVCWRRPSSWPSDCASAPAGDNPVTDPAHQTGTFFLGGGGITACAWKSNSDSFQRGSMEVTGYLYMAEVILGKFIGNSGFNVFSSTVAPLKGAIDAVTGGDRATISDLRIKCTASTSQYTEGGTPTITFYLIPASETPTVGPYLGYDPDPSHGYQYRSAWSYGDLAAMTRTALGSVTVAGGDTGWISVSQAVVDAMVTGEYDRFESYNAAHPEYDGLELGDGYQGPSLFVIGLLDQHFADTAPFKDTTNSDGFHLYGYDGGCSTAIEASVHAPVGYVMYDQPNRVIGPACGTTKMVLGDTASGPGWRTVALKSSAVGPVPLGTYDWFGNETGAFNSAIVGHPYKWVEDAHTVGWQFYARQGGVNDRDYVAYQTESNGTINWYDYTFNNRNSGVSGSHRPASVTGDGVFWIRNSSQSDNTQWDIWETAPDKLEGDYIDTVTLPSSVSFGQFDTYPGPGNRVIAFDYNSYFDILEVSSSDTGGSITRTTLDIPEWSGNPGEPFTGYYIHRVVIEPHTSRIWVSAYAPSTDGNNYLLVAAYDFDTDVWSNIISMVVDYDAYTYMADEWSGVGFSRDGAYLIGTRSANAWTLSDPSPSGDFEYIAANLGECFIRPMTLNDGVLDWAGVHRTLLYRDQGYWGYQRYIWGVDPWSGGLFVSIPTDMRAAYNDEDQEIWVAQFTALAGSGATEMATLFLNEMTSDVEEVCWALCPFDNLAAGPSLSRVAWQANPGEYR